MPTLTPKQKQILDYIKEYNRKHGVSPTFEEMGKHIGKAFSTVHEHVESLVQKGYLAKNTNSARGLELKEQMEMVRIPLLGTIVAGQPIEAVEERETLVIEKNKLLQNGNIYALRVSGDSMVEDGINAGDYIVVKQQSSAINGQRVVALIDDNDVTLKKFYKEKKQIRLQPANQSLLPLFFDQSRVQIQGIVLNIVKSNLDDQIKKEVAVEAQKTQQIVPQSKKIKITDHYEKDADAVLFHGDRLDFFRSLPAQSVQLVVTSPPYNIGKEYEKRRNLNVYLSDQEETIKESVRVMAENGSLCWQVGNHIGKDGEVFPLDILIYPICKKFGLKLRNRIIWHFGHGLHCTHRFSGRHETILWFTKSDDYIFNLDPVRVPQKYPGKKNFKKNAKYGMLSGNPLGKNPSDIWDIPNVKSNHPEKTNHPCQFPIELIERLVLSMTTEGGAVADPYAGAGSALCAALLHNRKGYGADIMKEYLEIAKERVQATVSGTLKRRMMGTPIYQPTEGLGLAETPREFIKMREALLGARS